MAEIQIQSDNHIYYFKTFDDFEAHKDEILNNSQIFIGEMSSGGGSGATQKVLWTNPDDTINFDPQIITLNSSDYDYLMYFL